MRKNRRRLGRAAVVRASLCVGMGLLIGLAPAQVWDETTDGGGDAGALPPGQLTVGTGLLASILGDLEQGEESADLYCISIPDPTSFTASYFNAADGESGQLWLFDAAGNGVAHACDDTSPYATGITPGLVTATGNHFIAITRRGVQPVDSGGNAIFPTITSGQTGPNTGVGPVAGWVGPALDGPGPYRIVFENASYHMEGDDPGGGDGSQPDGGPWWTYETADHLNYGNLFNLEVTQNAAGETACASSMTRRRGPSSRSRTRPAARSRASRCRTSRPTGSPRATSSVNTAPHRPAWRPTRRARPWTGTATSGSATGTNGASSRASRKAR
jgi:hypothetical protein